MFSRDTTWKWNHGLITTALRLSSSGQILKELKQKYSEKMALQSKAQQCFWYKNVTPPAPQTVKKQNKWHFCTKSPSSFYFFLQHTWSQTQTSARFPGALCHQSAFASKLKSRSSRMVMEGHFHTRHCQYRLFHSSLKLLGGVICRKPK